MRPFIEEFEKRRSEVRRYLAIIVIAERRMSTVERRQFDDELKIFRAGALLVLYNAIEASARLGILAIYDDISSSSTLFDDLQETLRIRVLSDFRQHAGEKSYPRIVRIAVDLVNESLNSDKLFSGNVDARKIRDMAKIFGFDTSSPFYLTQNGQDLLTVKARRQDLAHGNESFSEVGKQYTTRDVQRIVRYSLAYMGAVLNHIDRYLDAKGYRAPTSPNGDQQQQSSPRVVRSWRQRLARAWAELRSQ
ncbi:MAE_28990/MAE_18760 family HEPN-like nuclease [uncultured Sphingomonas sp.]|uniref:MAE_28990/MAE_18760 family HEPN-like nuclease n=1 Tax=uncultured Sphingomonas sp. TaxID=158754 RepID=UPI0025FDF900|nr:MAE_28990/MAE_18760 family HEPN-like nuclease [uncultured Sphingomonas sp.]